MTGKRPNRQSEQPKSSRRSALKVGGVALASLAGIGGAGASSALAGDDVDTDFDPDTRDEVVGFLNDVDGLSEQKQNRYAKELSKAQKEAIADLYMNANVEITMHSEPRDLQATNSYTTATEAIEAKGKVAGFGTVYVHKQVLSWDYNGDDYKDPSQDLEYSLPGPYATFQGKTEDDIDENSSSFVGSLSAEYAFKLFGIERGGEATIVTEGKENGDYEVIEKDAPTS
ncbi:hypothetical protein [Halobacterium jilantaiense]|uniref:Uncharacterized protein n=1 Tax=Halobacterium jilantaiense TaxID=355548 RepID=A0A1I0MY76_9EURY|nr:hypothetical protein [Halobacterium jilantaiense]SEV93053.1 hypothetical protein SAMN04487945_0425 [Halobacterium jilantaiense]